MKLNRRKFIKSTALLSGLALLPSIKLNASELRDIAWDEYCDVLVVGSGFAGSAAACEAIDNGAKTIMIDKMPVLGGNSAINGGAFAIVGSPQQKARKIEDSYEKYIADLLKAGRGLNDTTLLEVIAKNGYEAYKFSVDKGVIYRDALGQFGGHSVPRTIWPEINSGSKITIPLQNYARKNGVIIRTNTIFDDLILNEKGEVIGAKVRHEYEYDFDDAMHDESQNKTGTTRYYRVYGGVVMASGGFSYDVKFRQEIDPKITADLDCTNHYGATAYALKALMKNDVATLHLDQIQLGPWGSPDERGFGIAPVFAIPAFSYGIMVDVRTGKRFVNELADRKERSDAIIKIHKNADGSLSHPVVVCDSVGATGTTKANVYRGLEKGVIKRFDTIAELAKSYGIPVAGLEKSVADYNEFVKNGKDLEFNKPFFKLNGSVVNISKPPFYAWRAIPKVHHCMGGVKIDINAQVAHKNGSVIAGLYAAGEAVGGPHGASRLGSAAIPDCLVFGRIAGANAAKRARQNRA